MLGMGIGVGGTGGSGGVASSLTSSTANPASTGVIELAKTDQINWRNTTNTADEGLSITTASTNLPPDCLRFSGAGSIAPFFGNFNGLMARAGIVRLASNETINWNNNANSADVVGLSKTSGDVMSMPSLGANGGIAALTGTGACATFSGQVGGKWAGSAACASATAASTLTITPGTTAPNGWVCYVQDETTRANLFQQTSHSTTACTLTATSVTQNDVFVFTAIAF
jgi:hypothetical protein